MIKEYDIRVGICSVTCQLILTIKESNGRDVVKEGGICSVTCQVILTIKESNGRDVVKEGGIYSVTCQVTLTIKESNGRDVVTTLNVRKMEKCPKSILSSD